MNTYKNKHFTKRDYDCTNIVACVADTAPNDNWILSDDSVLGGLTKLHTNVENGQTVSFYGFL